MLFFKRKISYRDIAKGTTLGQLCSIMDVKVPQKLKKYKDQKLTKISMGSNYVEEGGALLLIGSKKKLQDAIPAATEKKVVAIFVDEETFATTSLSKEDYPVVLLPNSIERMGRYFDLYRNRYKGKLVAITGSVGKTTTRHFIEHVVGKKNTYINPRNFNSTNICANNVRTKLKPEYKVFIQEAGAGGRDTINMSSRILTPDISVITNIRPHHLNTYGSFENVFNDKIMLAQNTREDGHVIVNFDDEGLANFDYKNKNVVSFGIETEKEVTYRAINIQQQNEVLHMDIVHNGKTTHVEANILGTYNAYNILAAFAVGKVLGTKESLIVKRIKQYRTKGIRQNVVHNGSNLLFMDCYNLCNSTIVAAMEATSEFKLQNGGRKIVIVGGENKLGAHIEDVTIELGKDIKDIEVDEVVCFATEENDRDSLNRFGHGKLLYQTMIEAGKTNVRLITSFDELVKYFETEVKPNDMVLCKTILWLNTLSAVDKCFGTCFCLGDSWVMSSSQDFAADGFSGKIIMDMNEAFLEIADEEMKNKDALTIPSEVAGVPVYMLNHKLFMEGAFSSVEFGENLKTIGKRCFYKCTALKQLTLPDSLLVIMDGAFRKCTHLEEVHIGRGIRHIEKNAFAECKNLKKVYIPDKVLEIEDGAFPEGAEMILYE